MAIVRRNPRNADPFGTSLMQLRSEMDDLVRSFFGEEWAAGPQTRRELAQWAPALELNESQHELNIRAELPGMTPEDIDLSIEENILTLSGEKKEEKVEEGEGGRRYTERRYGSFERRIQLPTEVDAENVNASFDRGVLTVTLKKVHPEKAKKINVKVKSEKK